MASAVAGQGRVGQWSYWSGCGPALSAPEAVILVRGLAPLPSLFMIQMLRVAWVLAASLPSRARVEENSTLLPPDDQAG